MPWGLKRYHHTGQSHFVTFCCYHRRPCCCCLTKPFKPSELLAIIRKVLHAGQTVEAPAIIAPSEHGYRLVPLRILLAEDNPINSKVALAMLGKMGHHVISAVNGMEVVARYDSDKFDLVFMDIQMPEMDGLEAASKIRQQERTLGTHVPIIAMTANAMSGDREAYIRAGMDDYISKPISRKELETVIARVLTKNGHGVQ